MVVVFRVDTSVRTWGLPLIPLLACTPVDPPQEQAKQPPPIEQLETPRTRPKEKYAVPSWRWELLQEGRALTPDASWSQREFGHWFPINEHISTVDYVRVDQTDEGARIGGYKSEGLPREKRVWSFDFPNEVAVATKRRGGSPWRKVIVVAHHSPIASGTKLFATSAYDGYPLWEVDLKGLGPVDHSKYRNEVQLEMRGRRQVVVYGRESQGKYVELRDTRDGRLLAHDLVSDVGPMDIPQGDSRRDDHPDDGCEITEQLSTDTHSYALSYCYISSGATLTRHTPGSNEELWEVQLRGLGPVAHSEYFSNYKLDIHEGNPMVVGWEEAGSFLEIRDAETGEELWSIVKRD